MSATVLKHQTVHCARLFVVSISCVDYLPTLVKESQNCEESDPVLQAHFWVLSCKNSGSLASPFSGKRNFARHAVGLHTVV